MEWTTWGWLVVVLTVLPWRIEWWQGWHRQRGVRQAWRTVEIEAIGWRFTLDQRPQRQTWRLTLPLIQRSKGAVWTALQDWVKG